MHQILIDFYIDFLSIFARFWRPTWGHVGHIFAQNGGTLWHAAPFFVGSMLFFDFLAILAPSWLHFGGVGARFFDFLVDLGVDFGRFWGPVWRFLVTIWVLCAQSFWRSILFIKIWFWMGWCGFANSPCPLTISNSPQLAVASVGETPSLSLTLQNPCEFRSSNWRQAHPPRKRTDQSVRDNFRNGFQQKEQPSYNSLLFHIAIFFEDRINYNLTLLYFN